MSNPDTRPSPQAGDALLILDVQNDFLPGGSLAVYEGDAVVAPLNRMIDAYTARGLPVYVTRDWHPPDHRSFKAQGGPWPPHCIVGTPGAASPAALRLPGVHADLQGLPARARGLLGFQFDRSRPPAAGGGARRLFVGGLTTDYCVLNSVRDALALGYEVRLLRDAIRAVNVHPGDLASAPDLAQARRTAAESLGRLPQPAAPRGILVPGGNFPGPARACVQGRPRCGAASPA
ncbi:MAG: isochorismatase family protein [Thiobacillus sp.]